MKQFRSAFTKTLAEVLMMYRVEDVSTNVVEERTFQPVDLAVIYEAADHHVAWRATSFAALNKPEDQLNLAKAVHTGNLELRGLADYRHAELNVAVQLPKSTHRSDWGSVMDWMARSSDRVELFEDRYSIEVELPELLPEPFPV